MKARRFKLPLAAFVLVATLTAWPALAQTHTNANFLLTGTNLDLARGLYPSQQWRFDSYLEAKF